MSNPAVGVSVTISAVNAKVGLARAYRYDGAVAWNLDIGYEQFTRLCQALARDILGPTVRPLSSPRSPWDAEFDTGTVYWQPTTGDQWGGLGIHGIGELVLSARVRRRVCGCLI